MSQGRFLATLCQFFMVSISKVCLSDSERVGGRHGTRNRDIWSFSSLLAYVALGLASHAEPWFPWQQVRLHQEVETEAPMDPGRWNRYVVGMRECEWPVGAGGFCKGDTREATSESLTWKEK